MTQYSGQAEISGIGGGRSAQLSVILVLFILLCVVIGMFFPSPLASEGGSAMGKDPVPFNIVNQTSYVFFMYKISGDIGGYPTSFDLRPNGGSTTVYVINPSVRSRKEVTSSFLVHPARGGADYDRDGLVNVTMAVFESSIAGSYRRFDRVQFVREPIYGSIIYDISGLTLTFRTS
ncbi:hypothetical protein M3223_21940 [Paenibacillus pasadenensis]|uniref:hypothetical protein n=1 Tax=Paenibacillus pasadenensis TaxID=217090 RepID=UPI00203AEFA8|nr:hypothetical protein [Paenibacillus pasadenensis]MCM3750001.1 hypothetical protein [Paenibacillus pasadenensis]